MIGNKKILCVIQARSGSKGIPNKNIYEINNHPLISYSIAAAKNSKYIDELIVSSDSLKICKIANSYGAKTPFLRPKNLSTSKIPSVSSLLHAVKTYEKISNFFFDYIIELPCVSPLRDHNHVNKAIEKIYNTNYDSVISYVDTGEKHPLRLKKIINGKVKDFCKEYPEIEQKSFRQSFEPSYIRNGAIYLVSRNCLFKKNSRIGKKTFPLIMPPEKSVNIDEKFDLLMAKYLIKNGHCSNIPKKINFYNNLKNKSKNENKKNILVSTPVHFMKSIESDFNKVGNCTYCFGAAVKEIKKLIRNKDIWVCSPSPDYKIDKNILINANKLKLIITPSTGSNHISLDSCKEMGIKVMSLKNTKSVKCISASSEFTFGLMLSYIRKIAKAKDIVKSGHWRNMEDQLRGFELQGKTVGIVGYGRIGSNVSNYCKAFKMNIYVYDPQKKIKSRNVNQVSNVNKLLKKSDIVFICVHLNDKTKMMVNDKWFKLMKSTAILINTSRGEIIKESSLIKALKRKMIRGAAVDVVCDEQSIYKKKNKLIDYCKENENLYITPHIAGLTYESEYKAALASINLIKKIKNARNFNYSLYL